MVALEAHHQDLPLQHLSWIWQLSFLAGGSKHESQALIAKIGAWDFLFPSLGQDRIVVSARA
jgi:hypothetical protein